MGNRLGDAHPSWAVVYPKRAHSLLAVNETRRQGLVIQVKNSCFLALMPDDLRELTDCKNSAFLYRQGVSKRRFIVHRYDGAASVKSVCHLLREARARRCDKQR